MPALDTRPQAQTRTNGNVNANPATKMPTAGNTLVRYWDAKGRTFSARVLGPGTTSGLKLRLDGQAMPNAARIIDNVPLRVPGPAFSCYSRRV